MKLDKKNSVLSFLNIVILMTANSKILNRYIQTKTSHLKYWLARFAYYINNSLTQLQSSNRGVSELP